jgi:hypothetical protein
MEQTPWNMTPPATSEQSPSQLLKRSSWPAVPGRRKIFWPPPGRCAYPGLTAQHERLCLIRAVQLSQEPLRAGSRVGSVTQERSNYASDRLGHVCPSLSRSSAKPACISGPTCLPSKGLFIKIPAKEYDPQPQARMPNDRRHLVGGQRSGMTRGHMEKASTCDAERGALNVRGAARTHQ